MSFLYICVVLIIFNKLLFKPKSYIFLCLCPRDFQRGRGSYSINAVRTYVRPVRPVRPDRNKNDFRSISFE